MRFFRWLSAFSVVGATLTACASLSGLAGSEGDGGPVDAAADRFVHDAGHHWDGHHADATSDSRAAHDAGRGDVRDAGLPSDAAPDGHDAAHGDAGCDASSVDTTLLHDAVHIAVGNGFACAVRQGGSVVCWGQFYRGQLGFLPDGGLGLQGTDYIPQPFTVPGLSEIVSVAAGDSHACAVDKNGHVWCWGSNSVGQLGNTQVSPSNGGNYSGPNTQVIDWNPAASIVQSKSGGNLERAVAVACGLDHTCAIVQGGVVACWGNNDSGQLGESMGNGMLETAAIPSNLGLGGAFSLAAGDHCSCSVIQGASGAFVQCAGSNQSGQLGANPPDSGAAVTMPLPASAHAPSLVTSSTYISPHTVVLDTAGNAFGAGDNGGGALGAFMTAVPAAIPGLSSTNVRKISTGPTHTCAVLTNGTVQCIGANDKGELGRGFTSSSENNPDYVEGPGPVNAPLADAGDGTHLTRVIDISVGFQMSCAIVENACATTTGTVYCWGSNFVGQLGNGTQTEEHRPTGVLAP